MIAVIVIVALALVALVYVMAPTARPGRKRDDDASDTRSALARKDVALGALLDLEEERDLGKLSAQDFEALRDAYETEALAALKELDAIAGRAEVMLDDELEAEVAALRQEMTCPACGSLRRPGEPCSTCGD